MAGWCTLNVSHQRGASVYLRYAEYKMQPQTGDFVTSSSVTIDNTDLRNIAVEDVYIVNGTGEQGWELLEPEFTYRGFRYIMIASNYMFYAAKDISCPVVHSEGALVGNFTSSNAVIAQIQHNTLWSQISNTMSLMTDCPQRNERKGWLGDAAGSADLSMFNFDFVLTTPTHAHDTTHCP
jgi:alpha-L-rhamnosidase